MNDDFSGPQINKHRSIVFNCLKWSLNGLAFIQPRHSQRKGILIVIFTGPELYYSKRQIKEGKKIIGININEMKQVKNELNNFIFVF